jgi:hypothetical protein
MKRSRVFAAAAILACFGCNEQPIPVVFVPSVSGADQDAVGAFVSDFSVALQETPACSGVKLVRSDPFKDSPATAKEVKSSQWRLFVSVIPEDDTDHGKQLWSIDHNGHTGGITWSTPREMAASVCSIAKGKGGTIQDDE